MNKYQQQLQTGMFRLYRVGLHLVSNGLDFLTSTHSYDAIEEVFYGNIEGTCNGVRVRVVFGWKRPDYLTNQTAIKELCDKIDKQLAQYEDRREDYDQV